MTSLEMRAKNLSEKEITNLYFRTEEGIASDDEYVLFRINRSGLSEADARKELNTYKMSFLPDCMGLD